MYKQEKKENTTASLICFGVCGRKAITKPTKPTTVKKMDVYGCQCNLG
jgi:hypothetical protein